MSSQLSITNSLASLQQQATATLANINISFAIWKYDAPPEYQPLRNALSVRRRDDAEDGPLHEIALKLGALFAPLLPLGELSNLFKKYGVRASEIATKYSSSSTSSQSSGPFSQYAGIDATTILAAATSGEASIAVHLLACVLARQFSAGTATALWEQLVDQRIKSIKAGVQTSTPIATLFAARSDFSTQNFATWDAGARAWLAAADEINYRRQTQLMLILDNIEGKIATSNHDEIIRTWVQAMTITCKLASGMSHVFNGGVDTAILLALSSWHLYPDITYLGKQARQISFEDDLIDSGGNITLGLQENSPDAPGGIYWSLPLSRLRYYGNSQTVTAFVGLNTSHVSAQNFAYIVLGAVACYLTPRKTEAQRAAKFFISLDDFFRGQCKCEDKFVFSMLADVSKRYLSLVGSESGMAERLFKLGQRNRQLAGSDDDRNLFDGETQTALRGLAVHTVPVQSFAAMAKGRQGKMQMLNAAINAKLPEFKENLVILALTETKGDPVWWIQMAKGGHFIRPEMLKLPSIDAPGIEVEEATIITQIRRLLPTDRRRASSGFIYPIKMGDHYTDLLRFAWIDPPGVQQYLSLDDTKKLEPEIAFHDPAQRLPMKYTIRIFTKIYGDREIGLFSSQPWKVRLPELLWDLDLAEHILKEGQVDPVKLIERLHGPIGSLRTLAAACELFESMPLSSIALSEALQLPLAQQTWRVDKPACWSAPSTKVSEDRYIRESLTYPRFDRRQAFACIASLAGGTHGIKLEYFDDVIAISVRDSIYASTKVVNDPYSTAVHPIVRIPGNIGRPGVALLITPSDPKIRPVDTSDWMSISHAPFDGQKLDRFHGTELTLWFTDYERPIRDSRSSGEKFVTAFYIESVISVFDSGKWIADLNVLAPSGKERLYAPRTAPTPPTTGNLTNRPSTLQLITLDSWLEVLEKPEGCTVVRAHGNWQARLAVVAFCLRKGYHVVVLPTDKDYDWDDVVDSVAREDDSAKQVVRQDNEAILEHSQIVFVQ